MSEPLIVHINKMNNSIHYVYVALPPEDKTVKVSKIKYYDDYETFTIHIPWTIMNILVGKNGNYAGHTAYPVNLAMMMGPPAPKRKVYFLPLPNIALDNICHGAVPVDNISPEASLQDIVNISYTHFWEYYFNADLGHRMKEVFKPRNMSVIKCFAAWEKKFSNMPWSTDDGYGYKYPPRLLNRYINSDATVADYKPLFSKEFSTPYFKQPHTTKQASH